MAAASADLPPAVRVKTHKSFARAASGTVVRHGDMSQEVAERIFNEFLINIGEQGSTPESRDELLALLAEALITSTSVATDYTSVTFVFEDDEVSLSSLVDACERHYASENPLRTWVRCFRKGEIPARISDMLATSANVELRNMVAARHDVELSQVHLCFDTADGLYNTGRQYSYTDRTLIEKGKAYVTGAALARAQEKGDTRVAHDKAGRPSGEPVSALAAAAPEVRTGFKSVRG